MQGGHQSSVTPEFCLKKRDNYRIPASFFYFCVMSSFSFEYFWTSLSDCAKFNMVLFICLFVAYYFVFRSSSVAKAGTIVIIAEEGGKLIKGKEEEATKNLISSSSSLPLVPSPSSGLTSFDARNPSKKVPISVNFHFTRKCNYECGFCFHTAKTSHLTPLEDAKKGLKKLALLGMKKLNLSGGEPFLYPDYVGGICQYSKEVLGLESVSIVSNGSRIKEKFFKKWGAFVDILAISVDSFDEETNKKIGRGSGNHLSNLLNIAEWCSTYGVKFKLNTVVNRYNHLEDFSSIIQAFMPGLTRWKCFQVLPVPTENVGDGARRDCSQFLISDEEFDSFCSRHGHLEVFVPESNFMMKSSYIILDEYMRFLNKGEKYEESLSILDVEDVEELLHGTDWEPEVFVQRGGIYDWAKANSGSGCGSGGDPKLEW